MPNPLIGITTSHIRKGNGFVNQNPSAYAEAVIRAGGLPLLIPNEFLHEEISDLFIQLDGLLLSGGGDIDLQFFAGQPHPSITEVSEKRDQLEFALFKHAFEVNKPVLGICRGMQVINVALGGSLFTHIPEQFQSNLSHKTPDRKGRDYLAHEVRLLPASRLSKIIGQEKCWVNSFHHQAISQLAPGLVVTGQASDGLIEAIEMAGDAFSVVGVQWHPECLPELEPQRRLFQAFVTACQIRE